MDERSSFAVIVLAAGASRRMGQPKQLLPVNGRTLLQGVVQAAIDAKLGRVLVVLGANAEKIGSSLEGLTVEVILNREWEEGMGASIRAGMTAIADHLPVLRGVVIALGDQPGISAAHLMRLVLMQSTTGKPIIASRCAGRLSPPVLFSPVHFAALQALHGDEGARAMLRENPGEIAIFEADDLRDLDTPDDYAEFLKQSP